MDIVTQERYLTTRAQVTPCLSAYEFCLFIKALCFDFAGAAPLYLLWPRKIFSVHLSGSNRPKKVQKCLLSHISFSSIALDRWTGPGLAMLFYRVKKAKNFVKSHCESRVCSESAINKIIKTA